MKGYRVYIFLAFMLLSGLGKSAAQTDGLLDRLYGRFASSCIDLEYTYATRMSGVRIEGSGRLHVQDDMWHNVGNGIEIWCDGSTVWTVDPLSEEVIIEPVSGDDSEGLLNPALLFVRMNEHFNVSRTLGGSDGKSVIYVLEPKENMDIEYFNVELMASDASIRSGLMAMEDGNEVKISVASMKAVEKKPATFFRPSQTFDNSWIVTDLR